MNGEGRIIFSSSVFKEWANKSTYVEPHTLKTAEVGLGQACSSLIKIVAEFDYGPHGFFFFLSILFLVLSSRMGADMR